MSLNNDPNLELLLKLDETTGTNAKDDSSNNQTCTLTGGITFDNDSVAGVFGNALDFTAQAGEHITLPVSSALSLPSDFTICTNINCHSVASSIGIIKRGTTSGSFQNQKYGIYVVTGGKVRLYFGDGVSASERLESLTSLVAGVDTHVALRVTSGVAEVFFDGIKDATSLTRTLTWTGSEDTQIIGDWKTTSQWPLNAVLDDFRVYSRALTDAEIYYLHTYPYSVSLYANKKKSRLLGIY